MNGNGYKTDFLFATPSLLSGAARTLDMFAVFDEYNTSDNFEEADRRAIESDWGVVGQDMAAVIQKHVREK